jgi:nicotinamide mononucleotide transporter
METLIEFIIGPYRATGALQIVIESIAFICGILSVWYAKKAHILVYPTGLIGTALTVYLLYQAQYFGDMMMNVYYSLMSLYGWYQWTRYQDAQPKYNISVTNAKERYIGFAFFLITVGVTYAVYQAYDYDMQWYSYVDVVTSGIFFTAMWYMANKKIEHWILWIIADVITVPLYAYRGLGMLSLQYLIFTILAIQGLLAWRKTLKAY